MNPIGMRYGHIRVEGILGHGGMGEVYEGFDERLTRRVALKVLQPGARFDGEARTRFIREARTLSQLDHPNICRIYDFIQQEESDVLVLELIDGRTLEQTMDGSVSIAEKLRIARDVAVALVAAHRTGIVHRDLKPENVMLTKSGQVKVLDFGLARWLEQKTKSGRNAAVLSDALLHAVGHDDGRETAILEAAARDTHRRMNATAYGVTVGTPMFMSPEQARGESLTTASDMYSFGLVLQTMFSGREPYPEGLNARDIMLFASRGDSVPVTGVRRDIAALIKALKSFAPSDRPTAADALRSLQRIIDSPKRVARRVAVAAVVMLMILAGWKYTTDLMRERTAARQAEAEAKQRRAQADSLIEFMLGDLRTKLEPVGSLDVLDAAAERSLAYLSSLDTTRMTPQDIARNSKALNQLGDVRMAQGNLAAALAVFNRSLSLATLAAARDGRDPAVALSVGTAHFWVGNALQLKGDLPSALIHMREYRRIAEELARKYPRNDDYQIERIYGHSNVGSILEAQGDIAGALEEYRLGLAVRKARVAANPADTKRRLDFAVGLNKVGLVSERLGRFTEARAFYGQEFTTLTSLVQQEPKNALWTERLAANQHFMGGILEVLGDDAAAIRQCDDAVRLYRGLIAHDPMNASWQRSLSKCLLRHANLVRRKGSNAAALDELREAEDIGKRLLAKDPTRSNVRRDLSNIEAGYAVALLSSRNATAARDKAREAVALLESAPRGSAATRAALAEAYVALGDAEAAADNRAAATKAWQAGYELLQPASSSIEPRQLATATAALIHLGRQRDAQPLVNRLHEIGFREGDFERLLQLPR
ncbi:MAG TPA: protein kinase [Thermoanaerobaculia bacterium]|nr:protein kinase [Thermoanaerobaculia bacterium]